MGAFTPEPFRRLVRRHRRDAELTQEALAERAGRTICAAVAATDGAASAPWRMLSARDRVWSDGAVSNSPRNSLSRRA
jgi:hypothetical protein